MATSPSPSPPVLTVDTSVASYSFSSLSTATTTFTTTTTTASPANSSTTTSSLLTADSSIHSGTRTVCMSPEPHNSAKVDAENDIIWQVLLDLSRVVLEAKKDHQLLTAEIEDLMVTLESHCEQLGLDPMNVCHFCIPVLLAPATLTTRQALHRACDELYKDILRRKDGIERWRSRIITIAENIHEPPEPLLMTSMPEMSRARLLELETTYRTLEKEWINRLHQFQSIVWLLRIRWDQCSYQPSDDYDRALGRLFDLAEKHDSEMDMSCWRIEAPLCLSKECLARLERKLADLDQNYYTRQTRIKAMENVLRLIYQDLALPLDSRVVFKNEATVRYAAELGRELKALQVELHARKEYHSGQTWTELVAIWDTCLVSEKERQDFKTAITLLSYVEKLAKMQSEIETCRTRYSRCGPVYKLMMTRKNHIERMIAFEHTASDPKRLFQSSFQLVEEEKFRRRAYPTLLKLECTLIELVEKYEQEQDDTFMYEGLSYLVTLRDEIAKRHVNETVFAKFTPAIAAPTRSQTAHIMGRPASTHANAVSGILLTLSGIVETHPKALALATYNIQLGWLVLQIQGSTLVQQFGTSDQAMTIFKVWLVSMQFLDVNRRFLTSLVPTTLNMGHAGLGSVEVGMQTMFEHQQQQQYQNGIVMHAIQTYYSTVLCSALPTTCQTISRVLVTLGIAQSELMQAMAGTGVHGMEVGTAPQGVGLSWMAPTSTLSSLSFSKSPTYRTDSIQSGSKEFNGGRGEHGHGMKEMEYQVLFEVVAGLGVSSLMVLVWLVMALRQGTGSIKSVRRMSVFLHHHTKRLKGHLRDLHHAAGSQVDACIEMIKRVV
ncbi:hypothetical protein BGZ94_002271 [Podila epigama]|nr:hypothetical protein BGZ94_002271 [Podila epigama]